MTSSDPILRRFNGYRSTSSIRLSLGWKLRTEKFIDGAWVQLATFPTVPAEHRADQRERMRRHAKAFGGLVRLMRGERIVASWQDGRLECRLWDEGEVGKAAE